MKGLCPECGRRAVERPLMASGLCAHHHELRRWGRGVRDPWRSLNDVVIPGDEAGAEAVQRPAIEEARALARRGERGERGHGAVAGSDSEHVPDAERLR